MKKMRKGGVAVWFSDGSVLIRTPYNEGHIEEFHEMVPKRDREWLPAPKAWWVHGASAEAAVDVAREWFYPLREVKTADVETPEYTRLYVLPDAPEDVVTASFRTLLTLNPLHATERNQARAKIIDAYERIRKSRAS